MGDSERRLRISRSKSLCSLISRVQGSIRIMAPVFTLRLRTNNSRAFCKDVSRRLSLQRPVVSPAISPAVDPCGCEFAARRGREKLVVHRRTVEEPIDCAVLEPQVELPCAVPIGHRCEQAPISRAWKDLGPFIRNEVPGQMTTCVFPDCSGAPMMQKYLLF
jgi:hypothetical protein